eukprot:TRINITY_DN8739_c0_g1_i2.p1 TRINITY_DN8739_c0_g1~~TRINITY_DN8739_c0_g1_i2.p1  ORF type:complete len:196 (+),score=16.19 TRINITY_DN8739_c0_g1_i2:152-739(+)
MVCRQKRNHGCPATMVIDKENDGVIKRLHTHTHDNESLEKKVRIIEEKMIKDSASSFDTPKMIIGNMTSKITSLGGVAATMCMRPYSALANLISEITEMLTTTTNSIEGYNGAIAKGCPDKATLWTLIQVVRKEEALAYKKVTEALKGQNKKTRPRDIRRRARQNCLRNVVLNYEATTQRRYIQEVSSYYNIAIR